MKINIEAKKYINADPPELTEEMLDWLFLTMYTTRFDYDVDRVDRIDIVANQAYNGCDNIHFYITVNEQYEYHKVYIKSLKPKHQNPPLIDYYLGEGSKRWQWMKYFVEQGVDMGQEGEKCMQRLEKLRKEWEERRKSELEEKRKKERYQLYLELKEEFENE